MNTSPGQKIHIHPGSPRQSPCECATNSETQDNFISLALTSTSWWSNLCVEFCIAIQTKTSENLHPESYKVAHRAVKSPQSDTGTAKQLQQLEVFLRPLSTYHFFPSLERGRDNVAPFWGHPTPTVLSTSYKMGARKEKRERELRLKQGRPHPSQKSHKESREGPQGL